MINTVIFLKIQTKKGASMVRCEAIKGDGEQCTRNATSGKKVCKQHEKAKTTTTIITVKTAEPWTLLGLPEPDPRNGKRYIQKIRTFLNSSKGEKKGGYIYIFFLPREKKLSYWKIGYTERTVEERIREWSTKYPLEVYKTFKIENGVQYYESLIHLYLTYCRIYRYPHENGYQSVYKLNPSAVIQDGQQIKDDERLVAKNKEIEWFCAPIRDILGVIEPIVKKIEIPK